MHLQGSRAWPELCIPGVDRRLWGVNAWVLSGGDALNNTFLLLAFLFVTL
jgi:hypothetical protein